MCIYTFSLRRLTLNALTWRARSADLAQDTPDIAYPAKELCREFAVPTGASQRRLKILIRYLYGCPRLVYKYPWQNTIDQIKTYVDTDFAGCRVTRRSTSGGVLMRGAHCVRHWSATQPTIALSPGEAELGDMRKGAPHLIGFRSISRVLFAYSLS